MTKVQSIERRYATTETKVQSDTVGTDVRTQSEKTCHITSRRSYRCASSEGTTEDPEKQQREK